MKLCNLSIKALFLTLTIFGYINQTYAEDSNAIPAMKILWQKEVTPDTNLDCSPGQVAFDKTYNKLLITGTSFRPKVNSEGKFWLLEVEVNDAYVDKTLFLKDFKNSIVIAATPEQWLISCLTISEGNGISLIGKFDDAHLSIMKMNRQGNVNKAVEIAGKNNNLREGTIILNRIILPDNNLLLIGKNEDDNGVVVKISPEGNNLWEKAYKVGQGQVTLFSDGLSVGNNGNFIITGCSANMSNKSFAALQSDDFILQCDSQGNILKQEFFSAGSGWPNKLPQICQITGGDLLVVYDKDARFAASDIVIRAYSSDLKLLWEKDVLKSESIILFKLNTAKGNGFVLCTKDVSGDLKVCQYDGKGKQIAGITIARKDFRIIYSPNIVCADNKIFVVAKGIPEGEKGSEVSKIKIIALELK